MESLSTFQGRINETAGEASEANVVAKTTQIEDTSIALAKRPKVEHTDRGQVSIGKKSSRKMLKATPKQRSDGNVMGVRAACVFYLIFLDRCRRTIAASSASGASRDFIWTNPISFIILSRNLSAALP